MDTWMLDVLRIVSSVDVGHDEFSTQALVKKHKDVAEEIGSYRPVVEALHEQARTLPQEKAESEEVKDADTKSKVLLTSRTSLTTGGCCRCGAAWLGSRSATGRWWS